MKYQADERASEYRSIKNSSMATQGAASPKISALPAYKEFPSKPDPQLKTSFKINKRPQSATVRPNRDANNLGAHISEIEEVAEPRQKRTKGSEPNENLLFKTKLYTYITTVPYQARYSG